MLTANNGKDNFLILHIVILIQSVSFPVLYFIRFLNGFTFIVVLNGAKYKRSFKLLYFLSSSRCTLI